MTVKNIVDLDIVNYKEPSSFITCPSCTFKCDKDNGNQYCQNWKLTKYPNINIPADKLIDNYYNPEVVSAVVLGGLEPLDDMDGISEFLQAFRKRYEDTVVIYTGYEENEIYDKIERIAGYGNIIVKFGRYRPNQKPHYDELLGVDLASDNQYAKRIQESQHC